MTSSPHSSNSNNHHGGNNSGNSGAPARWVYWALAGSVALAAAGVGVFYYATQTAQGPQRGNIHKVVVNDKTCDPADFDLPAGVTTFEIHNASRRPLEWEILDGVMVVAERENIAPGFHSLLTVKLKPGEFEITCGLLSNPRGKLIVRPSAASEAERLRPPIQSFIGPLSENRVFTIMQANALVREAQKLQELIDEGDLQQAQALQQVQMQWQVARQPYKRMEAIVGRMADLENRLDAQARYLERGEDDLQFQGFHQLEKLLFKQQTLDGAAAAAEQLHAAATELQQRLREWKQAPEDLIGSALWQAQRLQEAAILEGENPYAQTDLQDLHANLEGMEKSVMLLDALLDGAKAPLAAEVRQRFQALQTTLDALKKDDAFPLYSSVDAAARQTLHTQMGELASTLEQVNQALGLE